MNDTISDDDIFALLATVNMAFLHVVSPGGRDRINQAIGDLLRLHVVTAERAPRPAAGKRRGRPRKKNGDAQVATAAATP